MYDQEYDQKQSVAMANEMDSQASMNFSMHGRFLPSFDIRSLKSAPNATKVFKMENPSIDIFEDDNNKDEDNFSIDVDKLSNYIQFIINIRER